MYRLVRCDSVAQHVRNMYDICYQLDRPDTKMCQPYSVRHIHVTTIYVHLRSQVVK